MFNTELEKIYDEKTVAELKAWSPIMENQGRHVRLAEPARLVDGMVFPVLIGIENWTAIDDSTIDNMCERITEGRPFIEEDTEWMFSVGYEDMLKGNVGVELWVK